MGLVVVALAACADRSLVDGDAGGSAHQGEDDGTGNDSNGNDSYGDDGDDDDDDADDDDGEGASLPETGFDEADVGGDDVADDTVYEEPCGFVLAESRHCAALSYDSRIHLVGLDSGEDCELTSVQWPDGLDTLPGGLAWIGDTFYTCAGMLTEITADGTATPSGLACQWVSEQDGVLWVVPTSDGSPTLREYAGWPEVLAGTVAATHSIGDMTASRFVADDTFLYGAWHSTDRVQRLGLDDGLLQPDVLLVGFDDWVDGFDVDAGELLIANHSNILRFDLSGNPIAAVPFSGSAVGSSIDCRSF